MSSLTFVVVVALGVLEGLRNEVDVSGVYSTLDEPTASMANEIEDADFGVGCFNDQSRIILLGIQLSRDQRIALSKRLKN